MSDQNSKVYGAPTVRALLAALFCLAVFVLGSCGEEGGSGGDESSRDTGVSNDTGSMMSDGTGEDTTDSGAATSGDTESSDTSDTDPDTDGGSGTLTVSEYQKRFFDHAICEDVVECEPKAGLAVLLELTCHPDAQAGQLETSDAGRFSFDKAKAEKCLNALESADTCEGFLQFSSDRPFADGACSEVIQGQQESGEDCLSNRECKGEAVCEFGSSCPGTCRALSAQGESCSTSDDCASGFYCGANDSCQPNKKQGESCSLQTNCEEGTFCFEQTCTALPTSKGDACSPAGFAFDNCPGELVCFEGSCQEGTQLGGSCGQNSKSCAPGGRCIEGTCVGVAKANASCGGSKTCVLSHFCSQGTCKPRPTVGEDCSNPPKQFQGADTKFCFRGVCQSGSCERIAKGESCDPSGTSISSEDACKNGYCESSGAGGDGTCTDFKSQGDECGDDVECGDGLECRDDGSGTEKCLPVCTAGN